MLTEIEKFIQEYNITTKVDEITFRNDTFDRIVLCTTKLLKDDKVKEFNMENITKYLKYIMEIIELTADVSGSTKKSFTLEILREIVISINGNTTVMLDVMIEKAIPNIIDVIIEASKDSRLQSHIEDSIPRVKGCFPALKMFTKFTSKKVPRRLLSCGKKADTNIVDADKIKRMKESELKKQENEVKKQESESKKKESELKKKELQEAKQKAALEKKETVKQLESDAQKKAEEAREAIQKVAQAKK